MYQIKSCTDISDPVSFKDSESNLKQVILFFIIIIFKLPINVCEDGNEYVNKQEKKICDSKRVQLIPLTGLPKKYL